MQSGRIVQRLPCSAKLSAFRDDVRTWDGEAPIPSGEESRYPLHSLGRRSTSLHSHANTKSSDLFVPMSSLSGQSTRADSLFAVESSSTPLGHFVRTTATFSKSPMISRRATGLCFDTEEHQQTNTSNLSPPPLRLEGTASPGIGNTQPERETPKPTQTQKSLRTAPSWYQLELFNETDRDLLEMTSGRITDALFRNFTADLVNKVRQSSLPINKPRTHTAAAIRDTPSTSAPTGKSVSVSVSPSAATTCSIQWGTQPFARLIAHEAPQPSTVVTSVPSRHPPQQTETHTNTNTNNAPASPTTPVTVFIPQTPPRRLSALALFGASLHRTTKATPSKRPSHSPVRPACSPPNCLNDSSSHPPSHSIGATQAAPCRVKEYKSEGQEEQQKPMHPKSVKPPPTSLSIQQAPTSVETSVPPPSQIPKPTSRLLTKHLCRHPPRAQHAGVPSPPMRTAPSKPPAGGRRNADSRGAIVHEEETSGRQKSGGRDRKGEGDKSGRSSSSFSPFSLGAIGKRPSWSSFVRPSLKTSDISEKKEKKKIEKGSGEDPTKDDQTQKKKLESREKAEKVHRREKPGRKVENRESKAIAETVSEPPRETLPASLVCELLLCRLSLLSGMSVRELKELELSEIDLRGFVREGGGTEDDIPRGISDIQEAEGQQQPDFHHTEEDSEEEQNSSHQSGAVDIIQQSDLSDHSEGSLTTKTPTAPPLLKKGLSRKPADSTRSTATLAEPSNPPCSITLCNNQKTADTHEKEAEEETKSLDRFTAEFPPSPRSGEKEEGSEEPTHAISSPSPLRSSLDKLVEEAQAAATLCFPSKEEGGGNEALQSFFVVGGESASPPSPHAGTLLGRPLPNHPWHQSASPHPNRGISGHLSGLLSGVHHGSAFHSFESPPSSSCAASPLRSPVSPMSPSNQKTGTQQGKRQNPSPSATPSFGESVLPSAPSAASTSRGNAPSGQRKGKGPAGAPLPRDTASCRGTQRRGVPASSSGSSSPVASSRLTRPPSSSSHNHRSPATHCQPSEKSGRRRNLPTPPSHSRPGSARSSAPPSTRQVSDAQGKSGGVKDAGGPSAKTLEGRSPLRASPHTAEVPLKGPDGLTPRTVARARSPSPDFEAILQRCQAACKRVEKMHLLADAESDGGFEGRGAMRLPHVSSGFGHSGLETSSAKLAL
uniref:Uncharacterized protein n=1 Tax=Chromera velia CCMP2878 TaxID=1169474 RepID=A0A0G4I4C2_9ALVE|eukprot:Cvel_10816.t1-p1 / transcript=Cvel_10816.t1 / gene=Cvel_10816 / organism=Chromera_velia_CCMP2878 / gene_product=hypothetical protein / transcript_product=hypothetical protein / location=Cvel_scaffold661:55923-59659(-) / protein_length=1167 / sequence_SO=supercontig / SO=protein_coding / is_pseudo=false